MRLATLLLQITLFTLTFAARVSADAPPETSPDERTLITAGLATDGDSLLEFFRTRTGHDVHHDKLMALVRQLGDSDIKARAQATTELVSHGVVAIPVLRQAVNDIDNSEVASRAQRCLQLIEGPGSAALPASAARLLALRRPAGTAEVLLAYLPFSDNQTVIDEVGRALDAVALRDAKPNPALLKALDDPLPLRRAVAGAALCRSAQAEARAAARRLLRDSRPMVRLRVGLALADQQDLEAIPVLIDLLAELSPSQRAPIETVLQNLACEWAPNPGLQGDDDVSRKTRRDAWAAWWRNTEGPALLAEFRKRTLSSAESDRVLAMIHHLGDDSFAVREQASADLVAYGAPAVPLLRVATRDADPERVQRAENCLQLLTQKSDKNLPTAAVRMLVLRKPAGAVEVLLDYLPFADNEAMRNEVQTALAALAMMDGKPDSVLVQALGDKHSLRRAAAAEALARAGGPEQRAAVCKLLGDSDLEVRFRVALALASVGQKEAVPVLIDLLTELPQEKIWPVVDFLNHLAVDKAPVFDPDADKAKIRKYRDAWAAWWKDNGTALDLPNQDSQPRLLGYTLVVLYGSSRVIELGRDGKPRWTIDNVQGPVDAYILGENRVLVAEYTANRVSERDFKGKVRWQTENLGANVVNAQPLPNGNTFIALQNGVMEVDRHGKTVFNHPIAIIAAVRSRNGQIHCLTNQPAVSYVRLDAAGKELKRFPAGRTNDWTSGIDVLPNGNVLIAQPNRKTVTEFDADGKSIWVATLPGEVISATHLSNGHTLVTGGTSVIELDRTGRTVWEYKDAPQTYRARRR